MIDLKETYAMSNLTSVRRARHDARRQLAAALEPINAAIAGVFLTLEGREGLTADEQAERLRSAAEQIKALPTAFATITGAADQVAALLGEAAAFAETRDFDAHQAAKAKAGEGALPSLTGDGFEVPEPAEPF